MDIDIEALSPRAATGVGLLALLPALWYAFGRPSTWGFVTAISTIVIVTALYIAMQPVAEQQTNESNSPS